MPTKKQLAHRKKLKRVHKKAKTLYNKKRKTNNEYKYSEAVAEAWKHVKK